MSNNHRDFLSWRWLLPLLLLSGGAALVFAGAELPPAAGDAKSSVQALEPQAQLRIDIDRTVEVIKVLKGVERKAERAAKLAELFSECFDIETLSIRTLKKEWERLKPEERESFKKGYAAFVTAFYAGKLTDYQNNRVEIRKTEKKGADKAKVYTTVEFHGANAEINYNLLFVGGRWRVADVQIEGVLLSSQYNDQFAPILRDKSMPALLSEMDKLTAGLLADKPAEK